MNMTNPHTLIAEALETLDISIEHPRACVEETDYWLQNNGLDDPELLDLEHLPFITMDNEDSRDLDQALYLSNTDDGYRVMYALADAAYYIRPGSALFKEALRRGTTYYTPTMAAAMLPTALSEGLISLNPQVQRRALVFDMSLDSNAKVTHCKIVRARIMSRAKLSYARVQAWLDQHVELALSGNSTTEPYDNSLLLLREVGNKLIDAATERGVIRFDRTDTQIKITGTPPAFKPTVRERFATERYNEQISLMCNMQGAELLLGLAGVTDVVQAVFRVHEAPLRKNLNSLRETLNSLAEIDEAGELWRWQSGQSLAAYVDALPDEPHHQRRVRAIQRQIMQAQRSSRFTPEPGEHHALKVCSYARFSSPMREIVGIFTHKELLEALSGTRFDNDSTDSQARIVADETLRESVIDAANLARQRQRQLDKKIELAALQSLFKRDLLTNDVIWYAGTIMGIRSDKMYISLDEIALDIKVYKEDLEEHWKTPYVFGDADVTPLAEGPTWRLGGGVELRIMSFDDSRQRLVFELQLLTP